MDARRRGKAAGNGRRRVYDQGVFVHPPRWLGTVRGLSLLFYPARDPPDSSHNCLNCCVLPPTRNQFPLPDRDCRYARRVRANAKRENPRPGNLYALPRVTYERVPA